MDYKEIREGYTEKCKDEMFRKIYQVFTMIGMEASDIAATKIAYEIKKECFISDCKEEYREMVAETIDKIADHFANDFKNFKNELEGYQEKCKQALAN